MTLVDCDFCGKEFEKKPRKIRETEHDFCCRNHYNDWRREKNEKVKCEYCKKTFEVIPARKKSSDHLFCCREHYFKWRHGENNPRYNSVEVECDNCGRLFKKRRSFIEKYEHQFCSQDCYSEWGTIEIECDNCGKIVEQNKSQVEKSEHHFCCVKCSNEFKSEKLELECDNCKKEFKRRPGHVENHKRHFCSRECRFEYIKKHPTKHPNWKGGRVYYYGPNWVEKRRESLNRDNHTCQICGSEEDGREYDVHHIIPFREFGLENHEEANELSNLITLCRSCHAKAERERISKEKLRGIIT